MYRKVIYDGYILGLAIGTIGAEITEQEYDDLTEIFRAMPTAKEGYEYRLTETLEWVEIEKSDEITDTEAFDIIFGGAE